MNRKFPRIIVAGAGLGGLAVSHRLSTELPHAKITIVDAKKKHHYQPGYTLLATGVWKSAEQIYYNNADLMPKNVEWIQSSVAKFNPDNNSIETENGEVLRYDFLVIATGLRLGYENIKGLDTSAFGQKGLGSVYASADIALKTWEAIKTYSQTGGRAVMTLGPTFMKCAGAPLKMTFMVQDILHRAGRTAKEAQIDFFAPANAIFSVPWVAQDVIRRWDKLPIPPQIHYERRLTAVDMDKQEATFADLQGNIHRESYDFLHVVPPMFAPKAVENSPLVVSDGVQKGWLDVDRETLQHKRYPNIFGIGDINGTPRGKTAATIKKSAPIVVHNLRRVIDDQPPDQSFDGYTSCPLLIRRGSALLVEFDGDGNATPTIPGVDPLADSYFAWYIEEFMLKPAYLAVLKGKVE